MEIADVMFVFCRGPRCCFKQTIDEADNNKMSQYPDFTEQQIIDLLNSKDSKNTVKANKIAVLVFEAFLTSKVDFREYSYDGKWTKLSPAQLALLLTKFYAEARTKKGDFYKRSTM